MDKKTFSLSVKQEICNQEHTLQAQFILLTPFLINNFDIDDLNEKKQKFIIPIYSDFLAQKFFLSAKNVFNNAKITLHKKHFNNQVIIDGNIDKELKKISSYLRSKQYLTKKDVSIYLAGVFLTCGSISSLENLNYHLEIQCNNFHFYQTIEESLKFSKLVFKSMKRREKFVIYFKKAEDISDFLKLIHAVSSALTFENQRIIRDFNNNIQKANNFDVSNMWRTVCTNSEQVEVIKKLIENKKIHEFSQTFQNFCFLRLKNETVSLSQLAVLFQQKYGKKISRSGMNYYANKLKKIHLKAENR